MSVLASNILRMARRLQLKQGVAISYTPTATGTPITLAPGGGPLTACAGDPKFMLDDGAGAVIDWKGRDYLIVAADLLGDDGDPLEPQRGDTISEITGDLTRTYTVMIEDKSVPVWTWSDTSHQIRRIHCKETGAAT